MKTTKKHLTGWDGKVKRMTCTSIAQTDRAEGAVVASENSVAVNERRRAVYLD